LALIARYVEEDGVCPTEAARRANIARQNIEKLSKLTTEFKELRGRDGRKKSSNTGLYFQLEPIKDNLLHYVFELRETGMVVDYILVLFKAASLLSSFRAKSYDAQMKAVECFMKSMGYRYRMGTHECQRPPEKLTNDAREWMEHIRQLITGPHRCWRYVIGAVSYLLLCL
jgi:hypothetical protein